VVRDLGDKNFFMLRNHSLLTAGESIADACARLTGLAAQARRLDASYRTRHGRRFARFFYRARMQGV
jgi:hypothetical protein